MRELPQRARLIRLGLALVWQAGRGWTVAWGLLLLAQGVIPALQVLLSRTVVNGLGAWTHGGGPSPWAPVALIGGLWVLGQWLGSVLAWVRTAQAEQVQDHIQNLIHRQALALDLAFFDNPESYDLLHRARVDALSQPMALLENLGGLAQSGLTLLLLAGLLAVYAPWLPLVLVASALPGLWTVGRHVLREHRWRLETTSRERRSRYYDWMLTERSSAAEMRLFDLGDHHRGAFQALRRDLRAGRLALALEGLKAELLAGSLAWVGGLAGMGWMLLRVVRGLSRLGDLVLCYQAFQQGQRLLRSLMENAGQIYRNTLFLENLFAFLSRRSALPAAADPAPLVRSRARDIRFQDVAFHYPGSPRPALDGFSLHLEPGSVTAVVGPNGAGKSTLIKLLCRFYDPQAGRILLDGKDLAAYDPGDLRREITVLFQEPVHYHATAGENIALGDLASAPGPEAIHRAAEAAGAAAPILRLPEGYATVLGKWFGGAELSVGEWQRVALARAFLRRASIIVLDEPTSAMDSWAEIDWLGRFRKLTEGCTTLMITHRFTTAMHADTIHVLDSGRLVESGTHEGLLAQGGPYARSWTAQMEQPCPEEGLR